MVVVVGEIEERDIEGGREGEREMERRGKVEVRSVREQGKSETATRRIDRELENRDESSKAGEVKIKNANILSHISNNAPLATDMRSLVRFAPRPHFVKGVFTGIAHFCKRTHLVVIYGVQSR